MILLTARLMWRLDVILDFDKEKEMQQVELTFIISNVYICDKNNWCSCGNLASVY